MMKTSTSGIIPGVLALLVLGCANSEPSERRMTGANPPPPPSPPVRAIDVGPTRGIYHLESGLPAEEAEKLGIPRPESQEADERKGSDSGEQEDGQ